MAAFPTCSVFNPYPNPVNGKLEASDETTFARAQVFTSCQIGADIIGVNTVTSAANNVDVRLIRSHPISGEALTVTSDQSAINFTGTKAFVDADLLTISKKPPFKQADFFNLNLIDRVASGLVSKTGVVYDGASPASTLEVSSLGFEVTTSFERIHVTSNNPGALGFSVGDFIEVSDVPLSAYRSGEGFYQIKAIGPGYIDIVTNPFDAVVPLVATSLTTQSSLSFEDDPIASPPYGIVSRVHLAFFGTKPDQSALQRIYGQSASTITQHTFATQSDYPPPGGPFTLTTASDDIQITELPSNTYNFTFGKSATLEAVTPGNRNLVIGQLSDYSNIYEGVTDSVLIGSLAAPSVTPLHNPSNTRNVIVGNDCALQATASDMVVIGFRSATVNPQSRCVVYGSYSAPTNAGLSSVAIGDGSQSFNAANVPAYTTNVCQFWSYMSEGATSIGADAGNSGGDDVGIGNGGYDLYMPSILKTSNVTVGGTVIGNNLSYFRDSVLFAYTIVTTNTSITDPHRNIIAFGNDIIAPEEKMIYFGTNLKPLATSASAAGSAPLPATPAGYLPLYYRNTRYKIPVYLD